jgi:hypothetical protein
MKTKIFPAAAALLIFLPLAAWSQTGREEIEKFKQEQKADIARFRDDRQTELSHFRDSLNADYARFLEEAWQSFSLQSDERSFRPLPTPPVFEEPEPFKPEPLKPDNKKTKPLEPKPQPSHHETPKPFKPDMEKPKPKTEKPMLQATFFGSHVTVQRVASQKRNLTDVSEHSVADFWRFLSSAEVDVWTADMLRIKQELQLNDWGVYLLADSLFHVYFPNGDTNGQVVFAMFMLNQLGYKAKIGRTETELVPLAAIRSGLSNTLYFNFNGVNYYLLDHRRNTLSAVHTSHTEYDAEGLPLDLSVQHLPRLARSIASKDLTYLDHTYTFDYNRNLVALYETYPCVDFSIYAKARLDLRFLESLKAQIEPQIEGKSEKETVGFLLGFTQYAFQYKEDGRQFGYEKWNFAEETLVSTFCDCEDRAIFFAQLVRNLTGLPTALVYYEGVHMAAAVRFSDPQPSGDCIDVNDEKYLICDPTFIGAGVGRAMHRLNNTKVQVFEL